MYVRCPTLREGCKLETYTSVILEKYFDVKIKTDGRNGESGKGSTSVLSAEPSLEGGGAGARNLCGVMYACC